MNRYVSKFKEWMEIAEEVNDQIKVPESDFDMNELGVDGDEYSADILDVKG